MAITRQKTDSLVETNIGGTSSEVEPKNIEPKKSVSTKTVSQERKPGFLKTTLEELKLVYWPSMSYVYKWSAIILVFTFVMAIGLGLFDRVFTDGVKFINCTSPSGEKQSVSECGKTFWSNLTGTSK